jgi:hypothetical protein
MIARTSPTYIAAGLLFGVSFASAGLAQSTRTEKVPLEVATAGTIFTGSLKGDETAEYTCVGSLLDRAPKRGYPAS